MSDNAKKGVKYAVIAEVKLKGDPAKLPDFGLGKGVIQREEIEFTDEQGRGFNSPLFSAALLEQERRLKDEAVEVTFTPAEDES